MAGIIPSQAVPGSDRRIAFAVLRPVVGNTTQMNADDGTSGVVKPRSFDEVPDNQRGWEIAGILTLLPVTPSSHGETHSESTAAPGKPTVELGYLFVPNAWGYGYATESLEALLRWYLDGVRHANQAAEVDIEANVHPDNKGSLRVLYKLGFRETGRTKGEDMAHLGNAARNNCVIHFRRVL
jgi:GNAT superfamily N-acetyltransferase